MSHGSSLGGEGREGPRLGSISILSLLTPRFSLSHPHTLSPPLFFQDASDEEQGAGATTLERPPPRGGAAAAA